MKSGAGAHVTDGIQGAAATSKDRPRATSILGSRIRAAAGLFVISLS